jgi:Domain of unknown function (DUF4249)
MRRPCYLRLVRHLAIVFLLLLISACSKLISDDFPDFETIPAVNSILVAGEPISLQVSLAEKIDTTFLTLEDHALIQLSDNSGLSATIIPRGDGYYVSDLIARPGENYACSIHLDGYAELYARDTVPKITEVTITGQTNQARFDEEGNYMEGISFDFIDDPATEDYYEVLLLYKENSRSRNQYAFNEACVILLNEGLEPYSTETLVFSDQLMEDSLISMSLDFGSTNRSQSCWGEDSCFQIFNEHTLILEFRHVSREYYLYKKHFYLYVKNRYPYFVEGTATAFSFYSNIENGTGIMAAYAKSIDSIFVEEEKLFID